MNLASRTKCGSVIGLTIVAFGTSAPEFVVNVFATLSKKTEIVLGNIVGSNIFNVLGVLGISAMIYPLAVKTNTIWIEMIPLAVLATVIVLVLGNDRFFENSNWSGLSVIDGIVLLLFLSFFWSIIFNCPKLEIRKRTLK